MPGVPFIGAGEVQLDGVMLVMAVAVTVPLLLGLFPRLVPALPRGARARLPVPPRSAAQARCDRIRISLAIGITCLIPLGLLDIVIDPEYVAIILSATALGIVMPVLKDAGEVDSSFGRLVIVACSVAEFASIVVLSMLFSGAGEPHPFEMAGKLVVLVLAVPALSLALLKRDSVPAEASP